MELDRSVHTGTATNRSNGLLQLPSFSYVLMFKHKTWPSNLAFIMSLSEGHCEWAAFGREGSSIFLKRNKNKDKKYIAS